MITTRAPDTFRKNAAGIVAGEPGIGRGGINRDQHRLHKCDTLQRLEECCGAAAIRHKPKDPFGFTQVA